MIFRANEVESEGPRSQRKLAIVELGLGDERQRHRIIYTRAKVVDTRCVRSRGTLTKRHE